METLFNSIQKRIADGMAELTFVDEDYGQLQPQEDVDPVIYPCALIDIQQISWSDTLKNQQLGQANVKIRLAIDCYDDSRSGSGTENKAYDRLMMSKKLHKLIQSFNGHIIDDGNGNKLDVHFSPLMRTSSTFFSLPGGIKVYETIYSCGITDRDATPVYQKVKRPDITINVTV